MPNTRCDAREVVREATRQGQFSNVIKGRLLYIISDLPPDDKDEPKLLEGLPKEEILDALLGRLYALERMRGKP